MLFETLWRELKASIDDFYDLVQLILMLLLRLIVEEPSLALQRL